MFCDGAFAVHFYLTINSARRCWQVAGTKVSEKELCSSFFVAAAPLGMITLFTLRYPCNQRASVSALVAAPRKWSRAAPDAVAVASKLLTKIVVHMH